MSNVPRLTYRPRPVAKRLHWQERIWSVCFTVWLIEGSSNHLPSSASPRQNTFCGFSARWMHQIKSWCEENSEACHLACQVTERLSFGVKTCEETLDLCVCVCVQVWEHMHGVLSRRECEGTYFKGVNHVDVFHTKRDTPEEMFYISLCLWGILRNHLGNRMFEKKP